MQQQEIVGEAVAVGRRGGRSRSRVSTRPGSPATHMMWSTDIRSESKAAFRDMLVQGRRLQEGLARRFVERAGRWRQVLVEIREAVGALRIR